MHRLDICAQALGIMPVSVAPGTATLTMSVREDMLNGHALCHGGMIFTLADSAFAHACNSRNQVTVAAGCSIEFMRPARAGDLLTARACETASHGRSGVYDILVTNQAGETVAVFRGRSRQLAEKVVDDEAKGEAHE